jgi:hypothetical protein
MKWVANKGKRGKDILLNERIQPTNYAIIACDFLENAKLER